MQKQSVSVVLVGAGGYGETYLKVLLNYDHEMVVIAGVVDISPQDSKYYQELLKRNIPVFKSLKEFYYKNKADLAIISTPIHLHKEHSCIAMNNGSNVLCEKPLTANTQEIKEMKEAREMSGKFLAVGFNWSFTASIQHLKRDILSGLFGKPKRFKSMTCWPRTEEYYNRSTWAGNKHDSQGNMIYDSVANNAAAHYLHNLFYLSGDSMEQSATLNYLIAELYKVNKIETFDTCALKVKTKSDIEIYYYATHAVNTISNPKFVLEFEKATICYDEDAEKGGMKVDWNDGRQQTIYQAPQNNHLAKLEVCINAIRGERQDILCGIEAATPHVKTIQAMHESVPKPFVFPSAISRYDKNTKLNWVNGLDDDLTTCYDNWCLPTDLEIQWSRRGKKVYIK